MTGTAIRRAAPRAAAALACALLAACAPLSPLPTATAVDRVSHREFELEGRISATDGERAASGQVEWIHTATSDRWTAYGPLGQIVARLDSSPGGAELILADGQRHRADDAASLLPAVIGVDVPLAGLAAWVQASPRAAAEVRELDRLGRPGSVIDQGWRIDYGEYHGEEPAALPRRLDITRGDARIRLLIDQWKLKP